MATTLFSFSAFADKTANDCSKLEFADSNKTHYSESSYDERVSCLKEVMKNYSSNYETCSSGSEARECNRLRSEAKKLYQDSYREYYPKNIAYYAKQGAKSLANKLKKQYNDAEDYVSSGISDLMAAFEQPGRKDKILKHQKNLDRSITRKSCKSWAKTINSALKTSKKHVVGKKSFDRSKYAFNAVAKLMYFGVEVNAKPVFCTSLCGGDKPMTARQAQIKGCFSNHGIEANAPYIEISPDQACQDGVRDNYKKQLLAEKVKINAELAKIVSKEDAKVIETACKKIPSYRKKKERAQIRASEKLFNNAIGR